MMKWYRRGGFLAGKCFSGVIVYMLLVRMTLFLGVLPEKLLEAQLLNPFPSLPNEELDFLKIITILGLYMNSFSQTVSFVSDMSAGAKETIRFRAASLGDYHWKMMRVIWRQYVLEYVCYIVSVGFIYLLTTKEPVWESVVPFAFLLFLVDSVLLYFIQRYSPSSVFVIVLFAIGIILRIFIWQLIWFVLVVVLLHLGYDYFKKEV